MKNISDFDGLEQAMEPFNKFTIVNYKMDPGFGYEHVFMFLIQFEDGEYGLCIYDIREKQFIEEPSDLEDYGTTLENLKQKYGLSKN